MCEAARVLVAFALARIPQEFKSEFPRCVQRVIFLFLAEGLLDFFTIMSTSDNLVTK
jgi:hypothetical protein